MLNEKIKYCLIENCGKKYYSTGYCKYHYEHLYKRFLRKDTEKCKEENCNENVNAKGLCRKHYSRKIKYKYRRTLKGRMVAAKQDALKRGKEWTLLDIEYEKLIKTLCFYCKTIDEKSLGYGLDRIDNTKGYHIGNVLPCCWGCNRMRGNFLSVEETQKIIEFLQKIRNKKDIWNNEK